MLAHARTLLLLVLVVACGPDVAPTVECGAPGASKILEFGDEPVDLSALSQTIRDERGWLVVHDGRGLAIECGAMPREFASDIDLVLEPVPDSGGTWLGYPRVPAPDEASSRVALDPWGGRDPLVLPGWPVGSRGNVVVHATLPHDGTARPELWKTILPEQGERTQR